MEWLPWISNIGLAGTFLLILFLALRSGSLWTGTAVERVLKENQKHVDHLNAYILRLEQRNDRLNERNEKLDDRNDLLARHVGDSIEMARAAGMVKVARQVLPAEAAERITP